MRKIVIWITVVALITSIVGTGVVVFFQTSQVPAPDTISPELPITSATGRVMSGSTLTGDNI